ncbi:zinc ion binding nucleic acid binding protein [Trifolium pratense]|uniref:Zinc ion binding nucleic acid binding protein n=1 Tax=Trifolium pratense TaxID=57577 RepID=A0A2K3N2Q8_TRIPR|nr:zinc ion binding nucleic acid binding protein [Trifolium pratense]
MNLVYYDESIILVMTSAMERPIKVDKGTLNVDWGRFIRICVKIDLSLPVVEIVEKEGNIPHFKHGNSSH